jgi:hypothetical protein
MDIKTCIICQGAKEPKDFPNAGYGKLKSKCKVCDSKAKSEKYHANLEANREKNRIKAVKFRGNRKDKSRDYDLKRNYGISSEIYEQMKKDQDGKCAICKTDDPKGRHGVFAVDHCHTTGKVRGLLCNKCNVGLGSFRDNVESLENAIKYLTELKK